MTSANLLLIAFFAVNNFFSFLGIAGFEFLLAGLAPVKMNGRVPVMPGNIRRAVTHTRPFIKVQRQAVADAALMPAFITQARNWKFFPLQKN